ncbi:MAG: ACT domain-containing protein, partial [Microthrixaceae bacterium]|nr:ACT domain-containing protein [Microthrixaceae bacterium]
FVPYAVNVEAAEASESVKPYLHLAENLGRIFAGLCGQCSASIDIEYQGDLANHDTRILTLSVLKGFFSVVTGEPVSYVNAPQIADEQGLEVRPTSTTTARDFVNLISIRNEEHSIAGTLVGLKGAETLVMIDDHAIDVPPSEHLLVIRNSDRPGMIGRITSALGDAEINISDMAVGASPEGERALMAIGTDQVVAAEVVERLRAFDGVVSVASIS